MYNLAIFLWLFIQSYNFQYYYSINILPILRNDEIMPIWWFPRSSIIYTDKNGKSIKYFSNINENSQANIVVDTRCYNWKKDEIILKSKYCNKNYCEFNDIDNRSLENIKEDLFWTISTNIYEYEINSEYRKYFFETNKNTYLLDIDWDSIPKYKWWDIQENKLIHPKEWKIPLLFSGWNDCTPIYEKYNYTDL